MINAERMVNNLCEIVRIPSESGALEKIVSDLLPIIMHRKKQEDK